MENNLYHFIVVIAATLFVSCHTNAVFIDQGNSPLCKIANDAGEPILRYFDEQETNLDAQIGSIQINYFDDIPVSRSTNARFEIQPWFGSNLIRIRKEKLAIESDFIGNINPLYGRLFVFENYAFLRKDNPLYQRNSELLMWDFTLPVTPFTNFEDTSFNKESGVPEIFLTNIFTTEKDTIYQFLWNEYTEGPYPEIWAYVSKKGGLVGLASRYDSSKTDGFPRVGEVPDSTQMIELIYRH